MFVGCGDMSVSSTSHMHELVVLRPQRVGADEDRLQHAVGVVPLGLVGARAVEAPDRRLLAVLDDLGLAAEERGGLRPVDPDVLGLVAHEFSCVPLLLLVKVRGHGPVPDRPRTRLPAPIAAVSVVGPYFAAVSVV